MGAETRAPVERRYLGIDPGLTGALATMDVERDRIQDYLVQDTPTVSVVKRGKRLSEYDLVAMHIALVREIMRSPHANQVIAVIEENSPRPGEGVKSAFRLGAGFWAWLTLLAVTRVPVHRVHPARWKRAQGLLKMDKNFTRMRARELFPLASLDRVKDHGRADALMLADYGRQQNW